LDGFRTLILHFSKSMILWSFHLSYIKGARDTVQGNACCLFLSPFLFLFLSESGFSGLKDCLSLRTQLFVIARNEAIQSIMFLDCFVPRNDERRPPLSKSLILLSFHLSYIKVRERECAFLPRAALRLHGIIHLERLPAFLKLTTLVGRRCYMW
jgi:hypothetical protein